MIRSLAILFLLAISLFITSSIVQAQIQRTFVSTSGTDAGNCNPSAPCRTFTYALTQTAVNGEIIALTSGGYGPVEITKAVQITAPTGVYVAITAQPSNAIGGTDAIRVNAAGATVVLRGLTLNSLGATYGIYATQVGILHIEGCVVNGFSSGGIHFNASGRLMVRDTIARNNSTGIYITAPSGTAYASIDRCRLEGNNFLGIYATDRSQVTVSNTVAANERGTGWGFYVFAANGQAAQFNCESCIASNLNIGFTNAGGTGAVMRVSRSAATNNQFGFYNDNGTFQSLRGTNMVLGNSTDVTGTITVVSGPGEP